MNILMVLTSFQLAYASGEIESHGVVNIDQAHQRTFRSEIVSQEYRLLVSLPRDYENSTKSYPVIYLLDAQWDFTTLVSLYGQLNFDGDIPELIIVGITWGGEKPNQSQLRIRDFSPTRVEAFPGSGGGEKFLDFFKTELIPFIAKEYRSSDQRILMGSSLGGLFTMYALFKEPTLFNAYLATAVAAYWDDEVLLEYAKVYANSSEVKTHTKVYSAVGQLDSLESSIHKVISYLDKETPSGLELNYETFPNIGHSAIKSVGNLSGLQYLFAKKEISLNKKQLEQFAGLYEGAGGIKVKVEVENNSLMITNPSGSKDRFSPMSDSTFFIKGYYETVQFDTRTTPTQMKVFSFNGELELLRME